jgi:2-C-methyl-D-erythritol 2,4-cyclodiphosphate synthase
MEQNIARVLHVDTSRVSVKATTNEGLGFPGEGLGIVAYAVTLIHKP